MTTKISISRDVILRVLAENPYPEDIFLPMTSEDWSRVTKLLQENGIVPDKVFGNWGRRVWNNCIDSILKEFQED